MKIQAHQTYRNADGIKIPSVTTALSILDKPALITWSNRLGLDGIDVNKYKDELADVGTLAHDMIMCHLKDEIANIDEYSPEQVRLAEGCYRQYIDWEEKNPISALIAEEPLISEIYQYGGRLDLYGVLKREKQMMLGDFKTNAKGIFAEMIYQVAAYRQLLLEQGYLVHKAVILRLGRGGMGGAEERLITPDELDHGFQIFMRCLEIYRLRRGEHVVYRY